MNLNDKNIDQIFRDAAQNSDAPKYDHSYWREMSSVLNDQDKRKRGFILWSIAGSFVSILLVSALFITNNKKADTLVAKNDNKSTNFIQKSVDDQNISKSTSHKETPNKSEKKNLAKVNINKAESKDETPHKSKNLKAVNTNTSPSGMNSSAALNGFHSKTENQAKPASKDNSTQTNSHIPESLTLKNQVNTNEPNNVMEIVEEISPKTLSPKMIAMQVIEAENDLVPFKLRKSSPFHFYTKLSFGLMENYETSRPFQSGVFDLSLNVEYKKEQVLFRTGLGIQATSNADIIVSERAKVYGFGITTHQNNLSYQSIYDIYIPLEIGYTLNNTSFGFGAQVNYMLGTTMNYESLENKVVVDESKIKGFSEGLNVLTAQGYVWLEQKLTNRFSAGVKVGTNLNSRIKEGKYFNESATTNPLYGQLTLRYNLTK